MMIKLKKIADNLSDEEHAVNASAILRGEFDGISLSYLGSAFGPVWSDDKNYDLGFLRHYRDMKALEVFLPGVECLESIVESVQGLAFLSLGEFKKKSVSLQPLSALAALRSLSLVRNKKDFEVIAGLGALRDLSLTGYQQAQLEVVSELSQLESLYLGFGSFSHLGPLSALKKLSSLEILWVKGLQDLAAVEEMLSLEFLGLGTLKKVDRLPALARLKKLKSVVIDTLNGLSSLAGLEGSGLQELAVMQSSLKAELFENLSEKLPLIERLLISLPVAGEEALALEMFPESLICESLSDFRFRVDRRQRLSFVS